eukprot:6534753-Lingulodinium_polyedra.AAC.1
MVDLAERRAIVLARVRQVPQARRARALLFDFEIPADELIRARDEAQQLRAFLAFGGTVAGGLAG